MLHALGGVAAVAVVGASASAAAALPYSGGFPGASDSSISFTVERSDGKLYVDQLTWGGAPWHCEDGETAIGSQRHFEPPEGRVRHRRFRIRNEAPENSYIFGFSGELRRSGKANGTLRYRAIGPAPSNGVCDTGKLEWRARR